MNVWDYFQQRDREIAEQSGAWDDDLGPTPYAEEHGSNGQRGRIWGRVTLTARAFLQVNECVQIIDGSHVTRLVYAYYLIYDGAQLWGEERDPTHDPAVHRHDRYGNRCPSRALSFKEVLTKAWDTVSAEDELRAHDAARDGLDPN